MATVIKKDIDSVIEQLSTELDFSGVASTQQEDRDKDIILASSWDYSEFMKNPVIMLNHDSKSPPVAKCTKIWQDLGAGELRFNFQFPKPGVYEMSDAVRGLIKGGFMNSFSVGLLGHDFEYRSDGSGGKVYKRSELLEISIVNVPANVGAKLLSAKSKGFITDKQYNLLKNPNVQDQYLNNLVRTELSKRGIHPDSQFELEHWEIDDIKYNILQQIKANNPRKEKPPVEKKDPKWNTEIIRVAPNHINYDFRAATMAECDRLAKKQEAEKFKEWSWI
jgi:phage head maturation protease